MKDLLIIIGTILILVILIDGIRRKRNERYGRIKVSRSLKQSLRSYPEDDEKVPGETPSYTSELPNGGARVVGKRDPSIPVPSIEKKARARSFMEKRSQQQEFSPDLERRSARAPQQTSLNLDESVPLLMESVEEARSQSSISHDRIEPSFSASRHEDLDDQYDSPLQHYRADNYDLVRDEQAPVEQNYRDEDDYDVDENYEPEDREMNSRYGRAGDYAGDENLQEASRAYAEDEETYDGELYDEEPYDDIEEDDIEDDDQNYDEDYDEQDDADLHNVDSNAAQQNLAAKQPAEPEEVLIINVMAHKGEMFKGSELLDIILKCGMRYGSMDIFHRYTGAKGEGVLLFSMANMVKPGTFDLDAMDDFETPGVSLFMTLPIDADSMQSFELMVDTAHAIADGLKGELKDEQRSAMTRQTLEHCRQRIRDFERMRLFRRPPR